METMNMERKEEEINIVLSQADVDLWRLRELALTEGGLVSDTLRKRAWPKLVGLYNPLEIGTLNRHIHHYLHVDDLDDEDDEVTHRKKYLATSLDFRQIELDVARCTWHLLTGSQRAQRLQMEHKRNRKVARHIRRKQRRLANLINITLVQSYEDQAKMRYYQGYHDVACIVLSTFTDQNMTSSKKDIVSSMGLDLPSAVLAKISQSHLRDYLQSNFGALQTALRLTVFPLLAFIDPDVHEHLFCCQMEPFFCLSWIITWFAHEVRDTQLVKRIFDFFIASHPLMPIYLSIAMVTHSYNREEILETECDFAALHQTLTGLPKNSSMVGWKYRPGDGYVSDDEHDEGTVSTATNSDDDNVFILEDKIDDWELSDTPASTSSCISSIEPPARVPFQDLMDAAVQLMNRVPPDNLVQIAVRYYGRSKVESLLASQDISLFGTPPIWTRTASAKADWVFHQYLVMHENTQDLESTIDWQYEVRERTNSPAVIAAGFGRGDDERKRKRRQRFLIVGAITIAVVAIAVAAAMQHQVNAKSTQAPGDKASRSISSVKTGQKMRRVMDTGVDKMATMERAPAAMKPKLCETPSIGQNCVRANEYTQRKQSAIAHSPADVPIESWKPSKTTRLSGSNTDDTAKPVMAMWKPKLPTMSRKNQMRMAVKPNKAMGSADHNKVTALRGKMLQIPKDTMYNTEGASSARFEGPRTEKEGHVIDIAKMMNNGDMEQSSIVTDASNIAENVVKSSSTTDVVVAPGSPVSFVSNSTLSAFWKLSGAVQRRASREIVKVGDRLSDIDPAMLEQRARALTRRVLMASTSPPTERSNTLTSLSNGIQERTTLEFAKLGSKLKGFVFSRDIVISDGITDIFRNRWLFPGDSNSIVLFRTANARPMVDYVALGSGIAHIRSGIVKLNGIWNRNLVVNNINQEASDIQVPNWLILPASSKDRSMKALSKVGNTIARRLKPYIMDSMAFWNDFLMKVENSLSPPIRDLLREPPLAVRVRTAFQELFDMNAVQRFVSILNDVPASEFGAIVLDKARGLWIREKKGALGAR